MSFAISNNSDNSTVLEKFSAKLTSAALRMITRRRLTEHQLRTRLEKKISSKWYDMFRSNISEERRAGEIQKILTRFRELGYVNDTDFAELFVRDVLERRPHGFYWIAMQLKKKGINTDIISSVLERMQKEEEYLGARRAAEKKIRILHERSVNGSGEKFSRSENRYQKIFQFLCRRGYDASLAFRVLDELGVKR